MGSFTLRDPTAGSALRDADNDSVRADAVIEPPPAPQPVSGMPALMIEIGRQDGWFLGAKTLGVDTILGSFIATWDPLTERDRTFNVNRGRSHELDRVEAGRGGGGFANRDGALNPSNTASPYYPNIRPMAVVRARAIWNAVTYDVFYAFAEGWPQRWTRGPSGDASVDLRLVDGFKILSLARVTLSRPIEASGARITAILDAISWPINLRAIDGGVETVQAVELAGVSALSHIQDVAESEGGIFFIAANGVATFYASNHGIALDPTDTWGDAGDERDYVDVTTDYDDAQLWNEITVTAPDLADQKVSDPTSISLYGGLTGAPRSLSVPTLLTTTGALLARVQSLLARYKDPKVRVVRMVLDGRAGDQWAHLLAHDLHDRVLVRKRPPSGGLIEQPSIIEGIEHRITATDWIITWRLSSTPYQVGEWTLGVVGKSELGETTTVVSS